MNKLNKTLLLTLYICPIHIFNLSKIISKFILKLFSSKISKINIRSGKLFQSQALYLYNATYIGQLKVFIILKISKEKIKEANVPRKGAINISFTGILNSLFISYFYSSF